jgi:hypothetical protein
MITKRQLGIILFCGGILALVALWVYDLVGASDFAGIGAFQRNVMLGAAALAVVGLTLLPLGDNPA